jgi:hypothetical protein
MNGKMPARSEDVRDCAVVQREVRTQAATDADVDVADSADAADVAEDAMTLR